MEDEQPATQKEVFERYFREKKQRSGRRQMYKSQNVKFANYRDPIPFFRVGYENKDYTEIGVGVNPRSKKKESKKNRPTAAFARWIGARCGLCLAEKAMAGEVLRNCMCCKINYCCTEKEDVGHDSCLLAHVCDAQRCRAPHRIAVGLDWNNIYIGPCEFLASVRAIGEAYDKDFVCPGARQHHFKCFQEGIPSMVVRQFVRCSVCEDSFCEKGCFFHHMMRRQRCKKWWDRKVASEVVQHRLRIKAAIRMRDRSREEQWRKLGHGSDRKGYCTRSKSKHQKDF